MSETIGLCPNVLVGQDEKYLCLTMLNSDVHGLLHVRSDQYFIKGNTITFGSDSGITEKDLSPLVESGLAYRLLSVPNLDTNNDIHLNSIKNDKAPNLDLCDYFTLTFVLDEIPVLPVMHYPFLPEHTYAFPKSVLGREKISEILSKMRFVRRVRLLSNDILNSEALRLEEFKDLCLETIISQDYYIAHFNEFDNVTNNCNIIVYIDDVCGFVKNSSVKRKDNANVSFYCRIDNLEELLDVEKIDAPVVVFPDPKATEAVMHAMLDYTVEDLMKTRTTRQSLVVNNSINPFYYGNIVVNNQGDILSYPFHVSAGRVFHETGGFIAGLKDNRYWYLKRSDYFNQCKDCAFLGLCPPLSNYEIILGQTFCVKE